MVIDNNITLLQILASDIDFCRRMNNEEAVDLHDEHKRKMYPPRISFEIDCTNAGVFSLTFEFKHGFPDSSHLDRQIMFPISTP